MFVYQWKESWWSDLVWAKPTTNSAPATVFEYYSRDDVCAMWDYNSMLNVCVWVSPSNTIAFAWTAFFSFFFFSSHKLSFGQFATIVETILASLSHVHSTHLLRWRCRIFVFILQATQRWVILLEAVIHICVARVLNSFLLICQSTYSDTIFSECVFVFVNCF